MTNEQPVSVVSDGAGDVAAGPERRTRSTIGFPYDDLDSAVGVARAVHGRGGRCAMDELAAALGYSGVNNGAFRTRVAAARTYGLIIVARDGIELTTIGQAVVDPNQEARARAEAFLAVPLYSRVYERYRGTVLPPQVGLERVFEELGVSGKQTDKARQVFYRSAEQAGFLANGRDRLVAPPMAPAQTPRHEAPGETPDPSGGGGGGGNGGGGGERRLNPFIEGLMNSLPEVQTDPKTVWPEAERRNWLTAAETIFKIIYADEPDRADNRADARYGSGGGESAEGRSNVT